MGFDKAKKMAEGYLEGIQKKSKNQLKLVEDGVFENDKIWVFFYNHKEYLESNDPLKKTPLGIAPIMVRKDSYKVSCIAIIDLLYKWDFPSKFDNLKL